MISAIIQLRDEGMELEQGPYAGKGFTTDFNVRGEGERLVSG